METILIPYFIGFTQILIIAIVLLLLFGGKKIPELMKGFGSGIKEFKNATKIEKTETSMEDDQKEK